MQINNSANVSAFDFKVAMDISVVTAKAIVTDISTYIGAGAANIIGINLKLISPSNLTFHQTIYPSGIDIQPGLTDIEINLPVFNGAVVWGTYKIYATLIDQDGTQYIWTENGLTYKSVTICKPNTLEFAKGNLGGLALEPDFDCNTLVATVGDATSYSYKGQSPFETEVGLVVSFPADTTGFIQTIVADFVPFTFQFNITGTYTIQGQVTQTYKFSETAFVIAGYYYSKTFEVQCQYSLCNALCDYRNLIEEVKKCATMSPALAQDKQRKLTLISSLIIEAKLLNNCGIDIGNILEQIKVIGGFECNCNCDPQGLNGLALPIGSDIEGGVMCGDVSMTVRQVNNVFKIDLNDISYSIDVDDAISDWVSFTTIVSQCAKKFVLSIDFCAAMAELGCGGFNSIEEDFSNIGHTGEQQTYQYDIGASFNYNGDFWIVINGNYVYIGQPATIGALVASLNTLNIGTFTIINTALITVTGYHVYGDMFENPLEEEIIVTDPDIEIDTTSAETLPNLFGSSAYDLSAQNSIDGNATLEANIAAIGFSFIAWSQGSVVNWMHYVSVTIPITGSGYNFDAQNATDFGIADPCSIQQNTGCVVFAIEFFDEYAKMMQAAGITKGVLSVNVVAPLYPYTNILIDWAAVDIGSVCDEIDLALAKAAAFDFDVIGFELGMELTDDYWATLFLNPGGAEQGEDVYKKLLTHTNASSVVSILQHIRSVAPAAFISVEGTNWDDYPGDYADWIVDLAAIDIDAFRQYYNFFPATVLGYQTARDRLAEYPDFFDFITHARFNGKQTFLSRVDISSSSAIFNKIAAHLIWAELYITFHKENLVRGDVLLGITNYALNRIFNPNSNFDPRLSFYYFEMLGDIFTDTSQIIDVTFTSDVEPNVVKIAVLQGTTVKIAVVNPTANTYVQNTLAINGVVFVDYTVKQRYAAGGDVMGATDVLLEQTGGAITLHPYSFSIITRAGVVQVVNFSYTKVGLHAVFTNNDGGASWLWDFGDGYTSVLENPEHIFLNTGTYVVSLTIDGTTTGTQNVVVYAGMQPLFGITFLDIGELALAGTLYGAREVLMATIGYKYQSNNVGSDGHWAHFQSKSGWPVQTPVVPTVGMGANLDEILFFNPSEGTQYNAQVEYNSTGLNYFELITAYTKATGKGLMYQMNIAHGLLAEFIQFMDYMISQNVPFILIYGGEESVQSTSTLFPGESQSSDEYLGKVLVVDDYIIANVPGVRRIINTARKSNANWSNEDVAAFALSLIPERLGRPRFDGFTQYAWVGNQFGEQQTGVPNSEVVIADYFTQALYNLKNNVAAGSFSIYGEILPRITGYLTIFAGLKMHMGQYGVSFQKSGYVNETMMHGILMWNLLFEFFKFNDAHDDFIYSATFLIEEQAVVIIDGTDTGWTIDPAFRDVGGTYAIRMPAIPYKMLNDLVNFDGIPIYIHVDRTRFPDNFDIVAFKLDTRIMMYVYNFGDELLISSVSDGVPASPITGNCTRQVVWAEELWGSIGNNVAHTYFAGNGQNPGLQKVNVQILDGVISTTNIVIKKHSMTRIEFTSISNATDLTITVGNFTLTKVFPNQTDPGITLYTNREEYAYTPPVSIDKLHVFLPGSNANPAGSMYWMENSVQLGFHTLGIYYDNVLDDAPPEMTASEFVHEYMRENWFGIDYSDSQVTTPANCIENRIHKLLIYMDALQPTAGWNSFFNGSGIIWSKLTVSGHSQGGNYVGTLMVYKNIERAIMVSSPRLAPGTPWGSFATNLSKARWFWHDLDTFAGIDQHEINEGMGVTGEPVDTYIEPESNWSHELKTTYPCSVGQSHKIVLNDSETPIVDDVPYFKPVWDFLLLG